MLILSLVVPNLYLEILDIVHLSAQREIVTMVGLRPIDEVPFPAVIIDNGRPQDPMGYIKHSKDIVTEEDAWGEGMKKSIMLFESLNKLQNS